MKKIKELLLIVLMSLLTIMQFSCNRLTPAGFWKDFQKQFILTKNSDQGPWGGYLKIIWKSDEVNTFDKQQLINYSQKNGWQLTDSLIISNDSITALTDYSDTDYSYEILKNNVMSFLRQGNFYYVFVFTTGWIAVKPGNATETEKNGFVVLNADGTELIVYHRWGE